MELFLLTGNTLVSPVAKAALPGFHCPKLLSHLALAAGAAVRGYKTELISSDVSGASKGLCLLQYGSRGAAGM